VSGTRAVAAVLLLAVATPAAVHAQAAAPARREPERVTFAEAVGRAAAQATAAAIALEEVRRSEALLGEARSGSLPLLTGNASYTRLDAARGNLVAKDQRNANLNVQVPLVAPSRWSTWAAASEGVDVARASEQDVRRTVVLAAARAYLGVLAQRRFVEVSRSARAIAKARFDFAHARRAGGIGNALDELRAEQQLGTSEAQLQNGEVALFRAQEALGAATGTDAPLDAAEEPSFGGEGGTAADAEARRLDVRAARLRFDAAEKVRRYSWADWLPSLVASGQAFLNDPGTLTNPARGWQVQFLLSLPLFEGGLRVGQLREREALEREARVQLDSTLRLVRSDVRLATDSLSRQEAALASARLAADRGRSVLTLATEAYKAGATNDLDVTTAQQQSRDADLQAVIAEDAVRQSRLDLLSAIGQFP